MEGLPRLQSEFKAFLNNLEKPCFKEHKSEGSSVVEHSPRLFKARF